jgi:hypothetical protein
MSKYYAPNNGKLWRRAKRSDRSEGAASPIRHIDPATVDVTAYLAAAESLERRKPAKSSKRRRT